MSLWCDAMVNLWLNGVNFREILYHTKETDVLEYKCGILRWVGYDDAVESSYHFQHDQRIYIPSDTEYHSAE